MNNADKPAMPQSFAGDLHGGMFAANEKNPDNGGLTKREYYAGLAMQGILAQVSGSEESRDKYTVNSGWIHPETVAKASVQCADSLLKVLES
jgi:hypothetical protein